MGWFAEETVSMERYKEDMQRLRSAISDLNLNLIRAQSAIRQLEASVDISKRAIKYAENAYHFRGPVKVTSTPDGVTVILLDEKEGE